MLASLSIRNFILIESADLEFQSGFTVITGETGAGKSILIDALMCALGERMQGELLKKGATKGYVEAIFSIPKEMTLPKELIDDGYINIDPNLDAQMVIIRREFTQKGLNRSFINDSPATASMARSLGEVLIDFHGQHDHQSLLKVDSHIMMLDAYAHTQHELSAYQEQLTKVKQLAKEYDDLLFRKDDIIKNRDQILFLLHEIEDVAPKPGELELLEQELSRIKNAVLITERHHSLSQLIRDDDASVLSLIGKIRTILEDLSSIDSGYEIALQETKSAAASLEEVIFIIKEKDGYEIADHDVIQERISRLMWLKKKHGTFERIFEVWDSLQKEADISEDIDGEIEQLATRLIEAQQVLGNLSMALSKKRKSAISSLESQVEAALQEMGIEQPTFKISLHYTTVLTSNDMHLKALYSSSAYMAYTHGIDNVEFMLSLNKGQECKPLIKAASGGEISRIMLALKSLISDKAGVPIMVFDEIDTGISGKVARKVGAMMQTLGSHKQIIAITHSPQIASLGIQHIIVKKTSETETTNVQAMQVQQEERIHEIAALISGATLTKNAIESAKELLIAKDIQKG